MTRPTRLDPTEVQQRLDEFPGWQLTEGHLCRDLKFADFRQAFGFMTRMALFAEKLDHHPDWSNVYNRVRIRLRTHDADGVTELDFRFVKEVERVL